MVEQDIWIINYSFNDHWRAYNFAFIKKLLIVRKCIYLSKKKEYLIWNVIDLDFHAKIYPCLHNIQ